MPQDLYLDRYAYPKNFIKENPHNRLGISVVIPCYNEPNLIGSLDSLRDAMPPLCGVEVIVVINQPVKAEEAVHQQNLKTLLDTEAWKREWDRPDWKVHVIYAKDLPRKHAGV
ncbi:MAG TPA: hypothetical protein DCR93_14910, partial [Cytophagales bacterium]|nr:hypothetical protein [Cytophagales bacterium]